MSMKLETFTLERPSKDLCPQTKIESTERKQLRTTLHPPRRSSDHMNQETEFSVSHTSSQREQIVTHILVAGSTLKS